jgi:hypothetical protein
MSLERAEPFVREQMLHKTWTVWSKAIHEELILELSFDLAGGPGYAIEVWAPDDGTIWVHKFPEGAQLKRATVLSTMLSIARTVVYDTNSLLEDFVDEYVE